MIQTLLAREKIFLVTLCTIGLVLSTLLAVFVSYPRGIGVDGALYALSGANLFMGNGLTYSDVPNTFLWPLFSVWIGLVNLVINDLQISAHIVLILSFILSIVPFYYSTKNLFNAEIAVIATGLYALNGFMIRLSGRLLAEMTLVLMLVMALYFVSRILKAFREGQAIRWKDSILSGFFLGLAYLTKPEAFQFGLILILFFWALALSRKTIHKHAPKLIALTLWFVLTISPQIIFIHQVTGKWVLTTYNRFLFRPVVEPFLGIRAGDAPTNPRVEYNYNAYIVRTPYTSESFQRDIDRLGAHTIKYLKSFFTVIGPLHFLFFLLSFILLRSSFTVERKLLYWLLLPVLTLYLWYSTLDRHFMMFIPIFVILTAAVLWKLKTMAENRGYGAMALWVVLLCLVWIQSYTPIANNAPTNRVIENHRRMGEWIRDYLPEARGKLIADRKPFIVFLAQGRYFRYNNPPNAEWLIQHLVEHKVEYLIVEDFMVRRYNPAIKELLEPKDRKGLQVIHVEEDSVLGRAILYRVMKE